MTLIIDMASGTEYQGNDLSCQNRQTAFTTGVVTSADQPQTELGLQLVETTATASSEDSSNAVMFIDMKMLFD